LVINSRRSEFEIVSEILTLAKNGTKKTRILYQTNLSYTQLQNYLNHLLETDMLKIENSKASKTYFTTDKGVQVADNIKKTLRELRIISE